MTARRGAGEAAERRTLGWVLVINATQVVVAGGVAGIFVKGAWEILDEASEASGAAVSAPHGGRP